MPPPRRIPSWVVDARLTVPVLLIGLLGTRAAGASQPDAPERIDHWTYLLVVIAALSLMGRTRLPWVALAVNTAAVAVYVAVGYPFGPVLLTVPVLAFGLAVRWPRGQAAYAVGSAIAVILAATAARIAWHEGSGGWADLLGAWLVWVPVVAAAYAIGATVRVRRESWAGVRAEQARRAASEEQLRMAQELHDVVGHGLAVIALQAGVALHVLDRDREKVRESLEAIRALSRESLDGLRTELAQLRASAGDAPERRPVRGIADLDMLVQRIRAGGVDVRLDIDCAVDGVPTELGGAAYRIVQESLTNVLQHAAADEAAVRVRADGGGLLVEVTDSGRGGADRGEGSGIRGMRQRAEALGGTFEAGALPGAGFLVRARLPLPVHVSEQAS